jgi:HSP20 family molecular chaperone IbpA
MFYNRQTREYPVQVRGQYGRPFHPFQQNRYGLQNEYMTGNWGWNNNSFNSQSTAQPCTDILELDDQYILEIALPGVVLDDVELKVEENLLTVIAKRTPNMFEERAQMLRKEMPCGYLVRHFEFETAIIHEHIEARMDRGILFVSIPKVEAALRIPVSAGSIDSHIPGLKTRVTHKNDVLRSQQKEVTVK